MRYVLIVYAASFLPCFWSVPTAPTSQNVTVDYFIKLINSRQSSWRAGKFFRGNTTQKTITRLNRRVTFRKEPQIKLKSCYLEGISIPETFDARSQWPECADVIGKIGHQGLCDGCWSFAATAVMSDRLCIQTAGKIKFQFSPQELISCCQSCGHGCAAGKPSMAWDYYVRFGIVSGGSFTSMRGCKPYQESEYFYNKTSMCSEKCDNPYYKTSYIEDKHFGSEYYLVNKAPECIQAEIMQNGPVQVMMALYEDFPFYKEGVYFYTLGNRKNVHSVKILGWGTEDGIPYWLAANSWGCLWGNLDGFFKIRRGYDECAIEQFVIAGNPKLDITVDAVADGASNHIPVWTLVAGVFIFLVFIVLAVLVVSQKARETAICILTLLFGS